MAAWNTSLVTDMSRAFKGATGFNFDISTWDTSSVRDMREMFAGATSFAGDVSRWNTASVESMAGMFLGATSFNSDLSRWQTSRVLDMSSMFAGAETFSSDLSKWDVANVRDLRSMFFMAKSFSSDLSAWDTRLVTHIDFTFFLADRFDANIASWKIPNAVSQVGLLACSPGKARCGGLGPCRDASSSRISGSDAGIEGEALIASLNRILQTVRSDTTRELDALLLAQGVIADKGWGQRCFCSAQTVCLQLFDAGAQQRCRGHAYFSEREWQCRPCEEVDAASDEWQEVCSSQNRLSTFSSVPATTAHSSAPPITTTPEPDLEWTTAILSASGFQVDQVEFNWGGCTSGCWEIDVSYAPGPPNAVNVLYLPRTHGDGTLEDGGDQYEGVRHTFQVDRFPCSTFGFDPGSLRLQDTACCVYGVLESYRPTLEFADFAQSNPQLSSACTQDPNDAPVAHDVLSSRAEGSSGDFVLGSFPGMPSSSVTSRSGREGNASAARALRLSLDEEELRRHAGVVTGVPGVQYHVETFVGMAQLAATGESSRVMEAFTRQVGLRLERTDFFVLSTVASSQRSLLNFVNLRLHQVAKEDDDAVPEFQYVTVTFTLPADYQLDASSPVVPPASIRVGRGEKRSTATFFDACTGLWEDPAVANSFASLVEAQRCAPAARMCEVPALLGGRFVALNLPLGPRFFDLRDPAWRSAARKVFVQLDVVAGESGAANATAGSVQEATSLEAMMVVGEAGVNAWCGTAASELDLSDIANADLVVGTAASESELHRVRVFPNIATAGLAGAASSTEIDADSIEGALMTIVVRGSGAFFSNAAGSSLELEDAVTIHILEGGDATFELVRGLLASQSAFALLKEAADHRVHLAPTDELASACAVAPPRPSAEDLFPAACVIRWDVFKRQFPRRDGDPATAIELDALRPSPAEEFMRAALGGSNHSAALGRGFLSVLHSRYALNGRFTRAFWIHPGYVWTPPRADAQERFSLSRRLVMVALVRLDAGGAGQGSRRMLLHTAGQAAVQRRAEGAYGSGVGSESLSFAVEFEALVAENLGVDPGRVTAWRLVLLLTEEQACLPARSLRAATAEAFAESLRGVATAVRRVVVTSARVERGRVDCSDGEAQRRVEFYAGAEGEFEAAVVFEDALATVNLAALARMEGVVEAEPVRSYRGLVVDNAFLPRAAGPPAEDNSEGWVTVSRALLVTAPGAAAFGMCLACAMGLVWVRSKPKGGRGAGHGGERDEGGLIASRAAGGAASHWRWRLRNLKLFGAGPASAAEGATVRSTGSAGSSMRSAASGRSASERSAEAALAGVSRGGAVALPRSDFQGVEPPPGATGEQQSAGAAGWGMQEDAASMSKSEEEADPSRRAWQVTQAQVPWGEVRWGGAGYRQEGAGSEGNSGQPGPSGFVSATAGLGWGPPPGERAGYKPSWGERLDEGQRRRSSAGDMSPLHGFFPRAEGRGQYVLEPAPDRDRLGAASEGSQASSTAQDPRASLFVAVGRPAPAVASTIKALKGSVSETRLLWY